MGLSLEEASKQMGVSLKSLHNWEQGKNRPGPGSVKLICKFYQIEPHMISGSGYVSTVKEDCNKGVQIDEIELVDIGSLLKHDYFFIQLISLGFNHRHTTSYEMLQRQVATTLRRYQNMNENETNRREALRILALFPIGTYGLTTHPIPSSTLSRPEEVLPHIASGLTACWQLANGYDYQLAYTTLDKYIPTLTALVDQKTRYSKPAATLVAEAYTLKTILAQHVKGLDLAESYGLKAQQYADIVQHQNLQAISRAMLANVHFYQLKMDKALSVLKEAETYLPKAHPSVRCNVQKKLAGIEASLGHKQEALHKLDQAYKSFYTLEPDTNSPLYANPYEGEVRIWEGYTLYHVRDLNNAYTAFSELLKPDVEVSERSRAEARIQMVQAELLSPHRDMERCIKNWELGLQETIHLKSEQRFREVYLAYVGMCTAWPDEKKIVELRDQLKRWPTDD